MRRQLIIIGLFAALSAGGVGGVLATALCADAGPPAVAEHACCRKETSDDTSSAESCPMSVRGKTDARASDAKTHAARRASVAASQVGAARLLPPRACAHCVGDTGTPPAAFKLRVADASRRGADAEAPRATLPARPVYDSFVPHVTPTQGAPPGDHARRHVLHSVFLI
ncbi:MAG TPA: hypothetical protein VFX96_20610 [Pyrinomonadaceae bacterium]|nr:hypothetical protein [Pyrinomonadaceae bacterium]